MHQYSILLIFIKRTVYIIRYMDRALLIKKLQSFCYSQAVNNLIFIKKNLAYQITKIVLQCKKNLESISILNMKFSFNILKFLAEK